MMNLCSIDTTTIQIIEGYINQNKDDGDLRSLKRELECCFSVQYRRMDRFVPGHHAMILNIPVILAELNRKKSDKAAAEKIESENQLKKRLITSLVMNETARTHN